VSYSSYIPLTSATCTERPLFSYIKPIVYATHAGAALLVTSTKRLHWLLGFVTTTFIIAQRLVCGEAAAHRCLYGVWTEHCRVDTFKVVLSKIQTHLNYATQLCSHADVANVLVCAVPHCRFCATRPTNMRVITVTRPTCPFIYRSNGAHLIKSTLAQTLKLLNFRRSY